MVVRQEVRRRKVLLVNVWHDVFKTITLRHRTKILIGEIKGAACDSCKRDSSSVSSNQLPYNGDSKWLLLPWCIVFRKHCLTFKNITLDAKTVLFTIVPLLLEWCRHAFLNHTVVALCCKSFVQCKKQMWHEDRYSLRWSLRSLCVKSASIFRPGNGAQQSTIFAWNRLQHQFYSFNNSDLLSITS